jgi:hypothetical protein
MKTNRLQIRVVLFVIASLLLLQISPTLAVGQTAENQDRNRHGVEVLFTKWVTTFPDMAGVVSGDVGGGTFAGEILAYNATPAIGKIEALYHINGSTHQLTAHVFVTQNNLTGTAVIKGVVTEGALKGARVRGEYQVIAPCGILNAVNGSSGDVCFQGTLDLGPDFED